MAAKKATKPASEYPPLIEIVAVRYKLTGHHDEFVRRREYHQSFGENAIASSWLAIKEVGYLEADGERAWWDEHLPVIREQLPREELRELLKSGSVEEDIEDLRSRSKDVKFNVDEATEWVAANFDNTDVIPFDCPHIIAWNLLTQARKTPANFFKEFLSQKKKSKLEADNELEDAEDLGDLNELRQAVREVLHESTVAKGSQSES